MISLLADISTVDAAHLKDILIIVFGTGGLLTSMGIWINGRRVQRREVSLTDRIVTNEQCRSVQGGITIRMDRIEAAQSELRSELHHMREQMQRDRHEILAADEERSTKIHDRINEVLRAVSRLEGPNAKRD